MLRFVPRLPLAGLVFLLALFLGRGLHTAAEKTFTIDEPAYVGTGIYLWLSGDYATDRVLHQHPPLTYHLASVPLLAFDVESAAATPRVGRALLTRGEPPPRVLRVVSRLPFLLLAAWGAVLCFLWAREVAGGGAGLLAAFLYTFSPSLLAYGSLASSDLPVAVFFLQTLYTLWRAARRPGPAASLLCGGSLGLALASKLSAVLLLGIVPLLLACEALRSHRAEGGSAWHRLRRVGLDLAAIGCVAAAVLWLAYGLSFRWAALPDGALGGLPLPAYLRSLWWVNAANDLPRPFYFLGRISSGGEPLFFPVAAALKETLGLLALTAAALVSLCWRRGRLAAFLAVPFAVYGLVLVAWLGVPLGWRYALPLVPLLCVFVATQVLPVPTFAGRFVLGLACTAVALESAAVHPHYLAFFNVLAGGPAGGHRYLLESNLDWGQDVAALARELEARGRPEVWLALFASEDPARYGVRGRPLPSCAPVGGMLAISANVRYGLYHAQYLLRPPVPDCYAWLDAYQPVARPGHSILLYELPEAIGPGPSLPPSPAPRPPRRTRAP